ncbi:MAG: carboxypeptidase regulatory-like domain-containing protein, partial [Fimbriimonadales bacterium]|nr:carboxypeptidase regulatory-like domain-containing protein [Fimbriimonadales bacterium]
YPLEGDFNQIQKAEEIYLITLLNNAPVPPGGEAVVRWAFTVSDGELETIRREKRRLQNSQGDLQTLRGRVVDNANAPAPDARVYLFQRVGNEEQFTTLALTDQQGAFVARLPEGEWRGVVFADHHSPHEFTIRLPENQDLSVRLAAPARLAIRVVNEQRRPMPCAVVFERIMSKMPNAERVLYGEEGDFGRFERVYFSLTGEETLQVEPGRYRITLTRGFEYEIAQREIDLPSGTQERFEATLQQTAPMPGYLSGDFHVHAIPSPDSNDPLADKVKAYLAAGVQILTATDHDVNTDYMPVIRQLGVQDQITSIVGTEITPIWALGHFNAYPQRYDPNLPNNGAVVWYDLNAAQIFNAARKNYKGDVIVQVNHPRSAGMGYFAYVGLDPKTGT